MDIFLWKSVRFFTSIKNHQLNKKISNLEFYYNSDFLFYITCDATRRGGASIQPIVQGVSISIQSIVQGRGTSTVLFLCVMGTRTKISRYFYYTWIFLPGEILSGIFSHVDFISRPLNYLWLCFFVKFIRFHGIYRPQKISKIEISAQSKNWMWKKCQGIFLSRGNLRNVFSLHLSEIAHLKFIFLKSLRNFCSGPV